MTPDKAKEYGERLRYWRQFFEITKKELAKRIYVSQWYITRYECGKSLPPPEQENAIYWALNISEKEFWGEMP